MNARCSQSQAGTQPCFPVLPGNIAMSACHQPVFGHFRGFSSPEGASVHFRSGAMVPLFLSTVAYVLSRCHGQKRGFTGLRLSCRGTNKMHEDHTQAVSENHVVGPMSPPRFCQDIYFCDWFAAFGNLF